MVRTAVPADAEALARCQVACWSEAYVDLVDPGRLAAAVADVDGRIESWRRILAAFGGRLLAEHEGEVVGFAAPGPSRDADLDVTTELYALYVRAAWWGTGLGSELLRAALGDAAALVWVFRDNVRARRAYQRHGFSPDGAEKVDDHFGGVAIRMVRPPLPEPVGGPGSA